MTSKTKTLKIAKTMFKKSLTQEEVDAKKVQAITKSIVSLKPANLSKILKVYKNLIDAKLRSEELKIEVSQKNISKQFEKELMSKTGAKKVTYVINPKLIAGAKITHGDWVYDQSLVSKLNQLTN